MWILKYEYSHHLIANSWKNIYKGIKIKYKGINVQENSVNQENGLYGIKLYIHRTKWVKKFLHGLLGLKHFKIGLINKNPFPKRFCSISFIIVFHFWVLSFYFFSKINFYLQFSYIILVLFFIQIILCTPYQEAKGSSVFIYTAYKSSYIYR